MLMSNLYNEIKQIYDTMIPKLLDVSLKKNKLVSSQNMKLKFPPKYKVKDLVF